MAEKKTKKVREEAVDTEQNVSVSGDEINELDALREENKRLIEELEVVTAKANEYQNDYLRARADCDNIRKHKGEDVRRAYEDGKTQTVEKILSIGDSLDWALKMPLDEKTREGIEMLLKKYHDTLESLGVVEFTPEVGTPFDPNTANAVMQMDKEDGEESGNIKQVFGRGYKLGDKVIRYAQVTVVK